MPLRKIAHNPAHVVVERCLADVSGLHLSQHLIRRQPACAVADFLEVGQRAPVLHRLSARHLQVHAGVYRRGRRVGAAPVGNDEAFEAEFILQDVCQQFLALRALHAVDLVVGRHDAPRVGFLHGGLEGG